MMYRIPGHKGRVGLISPMSHKFCRSCDRIRITSDGRLKPCLHSNEEIPLRGLHGDELRAAIAAAIRTKPRAHTMDAAHISCALRGMSDIGG
jgi:cyclic pyranopterin phosphate synthase